MGKNVDLWKNPPLMIGFILAVLAALTPLFIIFIELSYLGISLPPDYLDTIFIFFPALLVFASMVLSIIGKVKAKENYSRFEKRLFRTSLSVFLVFVIIYSVLFFQFIRAASY